MNIAIVGAGIFGMSASIELRGRNHNVTLFDQGSIPNPLASSTDVAKAIRRTNYLSDTPYIEMVERASEKWKEWSSYSAQPIYRQTGGLSQYSDSEFPSGSAGYESFKYLNKERKGIRILSQEQVASRFPQFSFSKIRKEHFVYDEWAGYLDSGLAMAVLKDIAIDIGIEIRENSAVSEVYDSHGKVSITVDGVTESFDRSIISAGPWITRFAPQIENGIVISRQDMAFFRPHDQTLFRHDMMPIWSIHPIEEGWYGFPLLADGTVKIAMDLRGDQVTADVYRITRGDFIESVKEFVSKRIPLLADSPFVGARSCLYTNTVDGDFIIDWKPGSDRILLAGGGSGHGFKFGGYIGVVIADQLEDKVNRAAEFFKIRERFTA